jgi:hypothetical protein
MSSANVAKPKPSPPSYDERDLPIYQRRCSDQLQHISGLDGALAMVALMDTATVFVLATTSSNGMYKNIVEVLLLGLGLVAAWGISRFDPLESPNLVLFHSDRVRNRAKALADAIQGLVDDYKHNSDLLDGKKNYVGTLTIASVAALLTAIVQVVFIPAASTHLVASWSPW